MTFNETIAGDGTLELKRSDTGSIVAGTTIPGSNFLRFVPDKNLAEGKNYFATLRGTVKDLADNEYSGLTSWSFSVNNATPPSLASLSPSDGTSADKSTDIVMAFTESVAGNGTLELKRSDTGVIVTGTSQISGNTLRFVPGSDLNPGVQYTVTLLGTVRDLADNEYAGLTSWNFYINDGTVTVNTGYRQLLDTVLDLGVDALSMATYEAPYSGSAYQHIVVGTKDGILLYRVTTDGGKPSLTLVHEYATDSKVLSLDVREDLQYILAGSEKDGLYVLDGKSDSSQEMALIMHDPSLKKVEGVSYASTATGTDYIYAASESEGLAIFEISGSSVNFIRTVDMIEGKAKDVTALSNRTPHRIYVLTNDKGVRVLDEDGNIVTNPTVPGHLNTITYGNRDAAGDYRVYAMTDNAEVYDMDLAGNLSPDFVQTFNKGVDFTTHTDKVSEQTYSYISSKDDKQGVLVRSLSDGNDLSTLTTSEEPVAANAFGSGSDALLAVLDDKGYVSIFNAVKDLAAPRVITVRRSGNDVTIAFSEYLDPATVSESDFGITFLGFFPISFSNFNIANNKVVTFTANFPLNGLEKITVSGDIKDRIGNSHNNGISTSYNIGG